MRYPKCEATEYRGCYVGLQKVWPLVRCLWCWAGPRSEIYGIFKLCGWRQKVTVNT